MKRILADGIVYDVIWNGAHGDCGADLFCQVAYVETPRSAPSSVEPSRGKGHVRLEVRRCEECGAPVQVSTRVSKADRATRRFCGRRCAVVSGHRARRQVAA